MIMAAVPRSDVGRAHSLARIEHGQRQPMPRVSVIMPAFNAAPYLRQAIESVLGQRFTDLELIVVDDGSTDETAQIAHGLAADDRRLKVLSQPNSGRPAPGRNRALAVAAGEYVSFLDADDYYAPDRVGTLVAALDRHRHWVAAFHDLIYVDRDGRPREGTYLTDGGFKEAAARHLEPIGDDWHECGERFFVFQSLRYAALHTQSVMIARERLPEGLVRFDERYRIVDDTDLWIRVGRAGRMGFLDRCLSYYRLHDTNLTRNTLRLVEDSIKLHVRNLERVRDALTDVETKQYRQKIARYSAELAYGLLLAGDPAGARDRYRRAFAWSPESRYVAGYLKSALPGTVRDALRGIVTRLRSHRRFPAS